MKRMKKSFAAFTMFFATFFALAVSTYSWFIDENFIDMDQVNGTLIKYYFDEHSGDGSQMQNDLNAKSDFAGNITNDEIGNYGNHKGPLIITEPVHLYNLAYLQALGFFNNSDGNGPTQYYFQLGYDFDGSGEKFYACNESGNRILGSYVDTLDMKSQSNMIPIGNETNPFSGVFNGNDLKVKNLTITNRVDTKDLSGEDISLDFHNVGFFGTVGKETDTVASSLLPSIENFFLDTATIGCDQEISSAADVNSVGLVAGAVYSGNISSIGVHDSIIDVKPSVLNFHSQYALIGHKNPNVFFDEESENAGGDLIINPTSWSDLSKGDVRYAEEKAQKEGLENALYIGEIKSQSKTIQQLVKGYAFVANSSPTGAASYVGSETNEKQIATITDYTGETGSIIDQADISKNLAKQDLSLMNLGLRIREEDTITWSKITEVSAGTTIEQIVPDSTIPTRKTTKSLPRASIYFHPSIPGQCNILISAENDDICVLSLYKLDRNADNTLKVITETVFVTPTNSKTNNYAIYFPYIITQDDIDNEYEFAFAASNSQITSLSQISTKLSMFTYLDLAGTSASGGNLAGTLQNIDFVENTNLLPGRDGYTESDVLFEITIPEQIEITFWFYRNSSKVTCYYLTSNTFDAGTNIKGTGTNAVIEKVTAPPSPPS